MEHAEADRTRLLDAAAEVLLAAVASDRTGPLAYFREILAAGRYLYDAQRRYADNRLVQELFAREESREVSAEGAGELTRERLMQRLAEVGELLGDDDEAEGFKRFLFELAEHVTKASGGLFAPRVNEDERAFLAELRGLLRMREAA